VKYDEGSVMEALEHHLEMVLDEGDSDEGSEGGHEMGGSNCDDSDGSTVEGERVLAMRAGDPQDPEPEEADSGGNVTSDSDGEMGENNMNMRDAQEPLAIGDTVEVNGVTWQRLESLEEDVRTEPEVKTTFTRLHVDDTTKEVEVFLQLMPLSKDKLLQIVRDVSGRERCYLIRLGNKRTIEGAHRGEIRAVQMRCTYCSKRNKRNHVRGRAPLTAWCCSVHSDVYACRGKNCWEAHVQEVRQEREREAAI
jgi:hypothetical protein